MKLTEDAGFRRYRNLIDRLRGKSITKPVYITETNTSGYKAEFYNVDREDTSKKAPPISNLRHRMDSENLSGDMELQSRTELESYWSPANTLSMLVR